MIPIERITEQEIKKRFGLLPETLRDALDSASNLRIVNRICKRHHLLDEEKMLTVRQISALVVFGFLHYYDVADEINDFLGLNSLKLAKSIAKELEAEIFNPIKTDLEKNCQPLPEAPPIATKEMKGLTETVPPAPAKPVAFSPELPRVIEVQPQPQKIRDLSQVVAPKPLSELPQIPSIEMPTAGQPAKLAGVPMPQPASVAPATPPMPKKEVMEPAPVVVHKETEFQPLKPGLEFRMKLPTEEFMGRGAAPPEKAGLKPPTTQPLKPAQVEIGKPLAPAKQPSVGKTEISAPRVIHYSQWKTPLEKTVPGASKPGDVAPIPFSELTTGGMGRITPSPPPPTPPPQKPVSPKPPSPPSPPPPLPKALEGGAPTPTQPQPRGIPPLKAAPQEPAPKQEQPRPPEKVIDLGSL